MKYLSFLFLLFSVFGHAQNFQDFEIELEPLVIADVPGVHSFSLGVDSMGRWLVIGGRIDGLHQRQPFAAFLASDNNTNAFVIDVENEQVWSTSLSTLSDTLFEQLQSTNQEFYQRDNQLYIVGGYGYSPIYDEHYTFPFLTAVDVNGATNAIINGNSITPFFRQIMKPKLAVTGGYLGYLDSVFYLAGGQYFQGRYNPMGPNFGPGFIQEYTNAIRTFQIEDDGINLSITNFSEVIDTVNLHRRDYNMTAQIFPNGQKGFTMFSGVFQYDVDLPFLNSVNILPDGHEVNNSFNQYLSQYHSAHLPIFDEQHNTMHTVFFGGMSQFNLDVNGNLIEDENVPFVKTISRVSRFANSDMEEVKLDVEMPAFVGAGAEFISHTDIAFQSDEILLLDEIPQQKTHVGYIFGGIESSQENIFFINDGTQSIANNTIFKVFIKKTNSSSTENLKIRSGNIFQIQIYPNPASEDLVVEFYNPSSGKVKIQMVDVNGQLVKTIFEGTKEKGIQQSIFVLPDLVEGTYFFSIENQKYKNVKTLFIE